MVDSTGQLYIAKVRLSPETDMGKLQDELEKLATELIVDIELEV